MGWMKNLSLMLIVILLLGTTGCRGENTNSGAGAEAGLGAGVGKAETVVIVDSIGRKVEVPKQADRIACLYAFTGHVAAMLNHGTNIVAAVNGLKRDVLLVEMVPGLRDVAAPMNADKINLEELVKAKPDLIFIREDTARDGGEIEKLNKTRIPYIVINDNTMEEQRAAIQIIGKALGKEGEALLYLDYYQDVVDRVQDKVSEIPLEKRIKIFHSINEATRTDAKGTLPAQWTALAGVINVSVQQSLRFTDNKYFASLEQIYLWDPDAILAHEDAALDYIRTNEQWASLRAVKENKVIKMPNGISRWGHPGSLETPLAILWTAKTFYPGKFTDLDMQKETETFYKKFFRVDLSGEEVGQILQGKGMRIAK